MIHSWRCEAGHELQMSVAGDPSLVDDVLAKMALAYRRGCTHEEKPGPTDFVVRTCGKVVTYRKVTT